MKTALKANEIVIKEGLANMQRGIETVGGKLTLTNQRLVFEPHAINFQSQDFELEVNTIQRMELCWTKAFGVIPLAPNSLAVYTSDAKEHCFVMFDRKAWMAAIQTQTTGIPENRPSGTDLSPQSGDERSVSTITEPPMAQTEGMVFPRTPPRSPMWMAFWGLLICGTGQMLCGQTLKGLTILIGGTFLNIVSAGALGIPIAVLSSIDAYRVATTLANGKPVGKWQFLPRS